MIDSWSIHKSFSYFFDKRFYRAFFYAVLYKKKLFEDTNCESIVQLNF